MSLCLNTPIFKFKYQGRQNVLQWAPFSRLMHLRNIYPYLISLTHFLSCYRDSTAVYLAIIFESISEMSKLIIKRQVHSWVTVLQIQDFVSSSAAHCFHMAALFRDTTDHKFIPDRETPHGCIGTYYLNLASLLFISAILLLLAAGTEWFWMVNNKSFN